MHTMLYVATKKHMLYFCAEQHFYWITLSGSSVSIVAPAESAVHM